jgi:probable HAF family extracellular repeat protein
MPLHIVKTHMIALRELRATALSAALVACSVAQAASTYAFKALDNFGGSWATGSAVNAAGTVVGTGTQAPNNDDPPMEPTRPARWVAAAPTDLGVVDSGPFGRANGINDAGTAVGLSFLPDNSGVRATLWIGGTATDLGTLGGSESGANAINKAGVVVGYSMTRDNRRVRPVAWKDGALKVLKDLGGRYAYATAISNKGHIAGYSENSAGQRRAVVWKSGTLKDLGNGEASGVNSAGTAVGHAGTPVHATQWGAAGAIDLGTLGGDQSFAHGINDAADVVGMSSVSGCCDYHATLWRNGVAIDLNDMVDASVRDAGWVLVTATAIDRVGHITGSARNTLQGVSRAYLLTP